MAEGHNNDEIFGVQSDDFHEYPCTPCSKGDRNVAAVKYCVECDENICGKCVSDHKRFSVMKCHQISDKIKTDVKLVGPGLPSQRCIKHDDKIIDVYCTEHDCVGCSTCIAIDHRSCNDIKYITDVANTFNASKEKQDIDIEIEMLEKRINGLKQLKNDNSKQICQEKSCLVKEVKKQRQRINQHLDDLERKVLQEVDSVIIAKQALVDAQNSELNCVVTELADAKHKLKDINNTDRNQSEQFVKMKIYKQKVGTCSGTLKQLEDGLLKQQCITEFHLNDSMEFILMKCSSLGYLLDKPIIDLSKYGCLDIKIRMAEDSSTCEIENICFTKRGYLVLTDYSNSNIKMFDDNYYLIDYCSTPDLPVGICEMSNSLLAVTLPHKQKIQIMSQFPLNLEHSFQVRGKCRGIAFYDEQLYVCCAGLRSNGEGQGYIEIYNLSGTLLRSYYEHLVCPWYVHIPNNGSTLLVSDMLRGYITEINLKTCKGKKRNVGDNAQLSGICTFVDSKQLIVSGCDSNNILLLSDGKQPRKLFTKKDGIVRPRAVLFDERYSRLFVSFETWDAVKIFTFKK